MAPTILIAGATGNTGRSVIETLSKLLPTSKTLSHHRILALTRAASSPTAQQLATFPGVEVVEQNWVDITADWLKHHEVVRAFIASHNKPNQFAEESTFHLAALQAGVQYVVRISTTAANVRPDCGAYYARTHWAIETLLSSPAFGRLQWTSLQPNIFSSFYLGPAAEFIKKYRLTGEQGTLRLMASKEAPVAAIDSDEVGIFAARLLSQDNPAPHHQAKYVLNGPEDITGEQVVGLVEQIIGVPIKSVSYKDLSGLDAFLAQEYMGGQQSRNVVWSIKHAPETAWAGECTASTTSKEVLELAAPQRTPAQVLQSLLKD
ncbi:NmrA-like family protein [Aspergillus saccharolyticus JOP 1030-1]|uniref:NmrA-like family protein n=1 Tax=Aspergillus saccharolyticus JOP 1030-1 TaxID=1450539 RepID=A0A318Z2T3_9EURO|nr:NmrA-like family protein [Aspergillus saccharolyticus JOP 1030-1]PYH41309.1 NmrA-like family protein [Aspergillus saccharolyticus JOP 1030-1]